LAAALLVIFCLLPVYPRLCLRDGDTGKLYATFPMEEGGEFAVYFIHSVNKTPVWDMYQVRGGEIYVVGTRYSGFGAGVPTELAPGQTLTYDENGDMLITGMALKMDRLAYVVGTVADHVCVIDGAEHSLRDLCGRNSVVVFEYKETLL